MVRRSWEDFQRDGFTTRTFHEPGYLYAHQAHILNKNRHEVKGFSNVSEADAKDKAVAEANFAWPYRG